MGDRTCSVNDCGSPVLARGWCRTHYRRWQAHGDPEYVQPPVPACDVNGCGRPSIARGWCYAHWGRWKATGDVRADVPVAEKVRHEPGLLCAVDGCNKAREKREWCGTHYRRWQRHGDPLAVLVIHGDDWTRIESYVDRSGGPDACHPWTGPTQGSGYGQSMLDGKLQTVHVLLWERENGPKPPGIDLDHECHNQAVRDGLCAPGICPHRLCCNLRHLVPRTRSEHASATVRLSSSWQGDGKGHSKLTEAQVRELRILMRGARGPQVADIACRYGISQAHAYRIRSGRAWGWLADAA